MDRFTPDQLAVLRSALLAFADAESQHEATARTEIERREHGRKARIADRLAYAAGEALGSPDAVIAEAMKTYDTSEESRTIVERLAGPPAASHAAQRADAIAKGDQ